MTDRNHATVRRRAIRTAAAMISLAAGSSVFADMTLTAEGAAKSFHLSTFATGFLSSGGVGPIPIDFQNDGTVLVGTYVDNRILRFNNTDNQLVSGATALNYPNSELAHGIAHLGGALYVSHYSSQSIDQLNADGSFNHQVVSGLGNARALVANPLTGRLLTSTVQGIRDVNPVTGAYTTLSPYEADGLTLSGDGQTLYGAMISGPYNGRLIGFDTTSGAVAFDSGPISGGIDGTAVGFGPRNGFVYGNLNNGTVIEINLSTLAQTVIATGGSRGDFVASDANGDLLLTQTDRVLRLSGIPEPTSAALVGAGTLLVARRRRQ